MINTLNLTLIILALSVALGEFFYMKTEDATWAKNTLGWLPLLSLVMFILAFSIGYGPIPWLMMGECLSAWKLSFLPHTNEYTDLL